MKYLQTSFFLFVLLVLISCSKDSEVESDSSIQEEVISAEDQILIDAITAEAYPLSKNPFQISDSELSFLNEIGDSRIIGLGESTHGTKEFFQIKHRVFQYLVENHGFSAFVFEMDMAEARIFNDWVQHRRDGSIRDLMIDNMYFWTWRTLEVKDLLEWMRNYNVGKALEDMIGFYGVDTQAERYNKDALLQIIYKLDRELGDAINSRTVDYGNLQSLYNENLTDSLVAKVRAEIEYVKQQVKVLLPEIEAELGKSEALWAERLVRNMEQVELVLYEGARHSRYYLRDLFMAENTSWFFDLLGHDAKMVLWAHNAHLANNSVYGGPWGGSQGNYLRSTYGDQYQIIGFSFAKGSFTAVQTTPRQLRTNAITTEPIDGSLNWYFSKSSINQFAIKTVSENQALNSWMNSRQRFLNIGAIFNGNPEDYYFEYPVQIHYDYLIHLDRTTNSDLLFN